MDESEGMEFLDGLIDYLRGLPVSQLRILNPIRLPQILQAEKALQRLAVLNDGEVVFDLHPELGYAALSLEAPSLEWKQGSNPLLFGLFSANNMEVYPLVNGNLRLDIMFYDYTVDTTENNFTEED